MGTKHSCVGVRYVDVILGRKRGTDSPCPLHPDKRGCVVSGWPRGKGTSARTVRPGAASAPPLLTTWLWRNQPRYLYSSTCCAAAFDGWEHTRILTGRLPPLPQKQSLKPSQSFIAEARLAGLVTIKPPHLKVFLFKGGAVCSRVH